MLRREGAALRLVPKRAGQTFGITQANCTRLIPPLASPRGHSRWFSFPSFFPSHFHLPASLGSTVVTRFSATTDALTPVSRARGLLARFAHQHRRVSLVTTLGLPTIPSPTIGVMTGDRPAVRRFSSRLSPALQASSFPSRLAHPRRPNRVHGGCSIEQPVLRTGRSGSVALHFVLPRRSYGSIPHGSSPHRSRLPLLYPNAIPGALGRVAPRAPRGEKQTVPLPKCSVGSRQGRQIWLRTTARGRRAKAGMKQFLLMTQTGCWVDSGRGCYDEGKAAPWKVNPRR